MDKFIIFTNQYRIGESNNPFEKLKIGLYCDDKKSNSPKIAKFGYTGEGTGFNCLENDCNILFLADISYDYDAQKIIVNYVKAFCGGDNNTYVVLHSNPEDPTRKDGHKKIVKAALGESFDNFLEQSHLPGSVYHEEIWELALAKEKQDIEKYNSVIEQLKMRFTGNLILEAVLYLHKHLTVLSLLRGQQFTDHKSKYLDTINRTDDNKKLFDSKDTPEIKKLLEVVELNSLQEGFNISVFLNKFNDYMNKHITRNQK